MAATTWSRRAYKRTCVHTYIHTHTPICTAVCVNDRMRALSLVSMGFQIFGGTCITATKML